MGFLHEGHLSLIREAVRRAGFVVVSVFVNPTQFGPGEDFGTYPRDTERDEALCRREGADVMFVPTVEDMYGPDDSVCVEETELSKTLCGRHRPGHFRGVTTVVAKLLNIIRPDVAVFGQKDAQQAKIIARMVRGLNFHVDVVVAPIVREPDGLAMSSRNAYLAPAERKQAACIYRALQAAEELYRRGVVETDPIRRRVREEIEASGRVSIDYVAAVDDDRLQPVDRVTGPTLLAVAVRLGDTRLIDNTVIGPGVTG
jgi:pantoate--beta-alanine ligase